MFTVPHLVAFYDMQEVTVGEFYSPPPTGGWLTIYIYLQIFTVPHLVAFYDMQEVTVSEFYSPPPTGGHITRTLCNKVTLLHSQNY